MFGMQFGVASSDEEDDPPDSTAILGATPLHAKPKGATTEFSFVSTSKVDMVAQCGEV